MNTINNNKDNLIAGTVGAVTGPVVAVGGLKALGFTTIGILKGSPAAALMSKVAIISGGAIKTGTPIAVAQSIGAAGLGLTGVALTAGGGIIAIGGGYMLYKHRGDIISIFRSKM